MCSLGDAVCLARTAYQIYDLGFSRIHNANDQYRELGADIKCLGSNLDILAKVSSRARQRSQSSEITASRFTAFEHLDQVIHDSQSALADCERFLSDRRVFQRLDCGGFITNIIWSLGAGPEATQLRQRVAFLNIKLNTILKTIDLHILEDLQYQIEKSTDIIVGHIERLAGELGVGLEPLQVPEELEKLFSNVALQTYPRLEFAPLGSTIDTALNYLEKAKNETGLSDHARILNLMISRWILNIVKTGHGYLTTCSALPNNDFEQHLRDWGMTVGRFVLKLEEELRQVHIKVAANITLADVEGDIISLFRSQPDIHWLAGPDVQRDPEWELTHLVKIMTSPLRSQFPQYVQKLSLYEQDEKTLTMILSSTHLSHGRILDEKETVRLDSVNLDPLYASAEPRPDTYNVTISCGKGLTTALCFFSIGKLREFQQAITGYKVVRDYPTTVFKSYEGRHFKGTTKTRSGRLQLWDRAAPKSDAAAGWLATRSLSSPAGPSSSSSGMSGSLDRRLSYTTSTSSSTSSNWLGGALTIHISTVDRDGNRGYTLERPELPCLVFFLKPNGQEDHGRGFTSYMHIQIDQYTFINTKACDCENPDSQCTLSVLESSSRLIARRFESPNLAAAGMFQRSAAPEPIKKLRHVTIEFPDSRGCEDFAKWLKDIQELTKIRMAEYYARLNGR